MQHYKLLLPFLHILAVSELCFLWHYPYMHGQDFIRLFKDLIHFHTLIKRSVKNAHHDVTFTYLSSDSQIHKLSNSLLLIPQKSSRIWTAVSELWIRWILSLPSTPSPSERVRGSQTLNLHWQCELCNQTLTCRWIHLLLRRSFPFTSKMEKKPPGPPCPPSLFFLELNSCFRYTRSLS